MRNENAPINREAGRIQMIRVKTASHTPPLLYPINVIVCVEDAPGKSWQNPLYSSNSSLVHKVAHEQKFSSSWQYEPEVHRRRLYFVKKQTLRNEGGEGSPSLNIKNFRTDKMIIL